MVVKLRRTQPGANRAARRAGSAPKLPDQVLYPGEPVGLNPRELKDVRATVTPIGTRVDMTIDFDHSVVVQESSPTRDVIIYTGPDGEPRTLTDGQITAERISGVLIDGTYATVVSEREKPVSQASTRNRSRR